MSEWIYDPAVANAFAKQHARPTNLPPHWVRCDFMKDGVRCRKGEGHEHLPNDSGHEEPKT